MRRIYLDNAASAPMLPAVKKAMSDFMKESGNASSLHEEGRKAHRMIEHSRRVIAEAIGARPSEIVFTSGGSEANNMVINTFDDKKIAVSSIEHPSILEPAKKKAAKILPVDSVGVVKKIDGSMKVDLISVMMANNEIGTIQDVKKLAHEAHKSGALFHTDATQGFGKLIIDVNNLGVDYMTLSSHKIGGPKGIGALYIREGSPIRPMIIGGHQERNLRAGTENVLAIIGFSSAVENYYLPRANTLRQRLLEGIVASIPNVIVNGDQEHCLSNILNVTFAGVEGESILLRLDAKGIAVSTGSACATGDIKSSHVLMAIGADPEKAHGSIRFSFGPTNTQKDVDAVLKVLPSIISDLRKMSTIGGKYE